MHNNKTIERVYTKIKVKINMQQNSFSWIAREDKTAYSKDAEYIVGAIAFILFITCILVKNFFIIPFIILSACIIIFSMRKSAQCTVYVIEKKGISTGDITHTWNNIEEYNLIDDPGIKGRLIIKTNTLYGVVVCPIYDEDMKTVSTLMKQYNIQQNKDLYIPLIKTLTRFY